MKYVYMVKFDWSIDDDSNIDISLFKNYDDAYAFYKQLISDEMNPDLSWVGSDAFDEDGNVNDGYDLDYDDNNSNNSDVYWHVTDESNGWRYSRLDLMKVEVR